MKEERMVQVGVRMPPSMIEEIKSIAGLDPESDFSAEVRKAVRDFLDKKRSVK